MRKNVIIFTGVIFIIIASCVVTHCITLRKYVDMYKIDQWPFQSYFELKSVEVNKENTMETLSMFDDGLMIHVVIKGELSTKGIPDRPFIKKIHVSERIVYDENMQRKAIIELTPVIGVKAMNQRSDKDYEAIPIEYSFNYKLKTFEPSADNIFLIRCGDIDTEISVYQDK